ncbi:hypothetical protein [Oceanobacillus locisalsi]|uniref:Lipoprotein n=1 Tax=Oceanobacillus locisalsi TaxID=546107 RepID=A0ABW3NK23_9BACI
MKKIIIPIFIVIIALLLVSCEDKDEVADEIVEFYNEEWVPINDMKEKGMADIPLELTRLEEEGESDEVIGLIKDEIIPLLDRVMERLKSVNPKNEKIEKMIDLQIEAEEFSKNIFGEARTYYENDNVTDQDIEQYNEELDEKYQEVLDYRDELMEEYNLEQIEKKDRDSNFYKLKREED